MGLKHSFKTARKRIASLDGDEREALLAICRDIRHAQEALTKKTFKAAPVLANCMAAVRACAAAISILPISSPSGIWCIILTMAPADRGSHGGLPCPRKFFPFGLHFP
jgi:hypothetical protein